MKSYLLTGVSVLGLLSSATEPHTATACQCDYRSLARNDFETADAVFLGELVEQEPSVASYRRVNFRVLQAWKGVTGSEIGLRVGTGLAVCHFWGEVGEQYLVYARKRETRFWWESWGCYSDDRLYTSACTTRWIGSLSQFVEHEIAELERLGIEPIEFSDGPDTRYPAGPLGDPEEEEAACFSQPTEHRGFCGAGILAACGLCLPMLFMTRRHGPRKIGAGVAPLL
ncbi:MAG: hypothetical protein ACYSVY_03130 [Planctomycetota bacterium]|jgi:hypothetical protein